MAPRPAIARQRLGMAAVVVGALSSCAGFVVIIVGGFPPRFSENPGTWLCAIGMLLMLAGIRPAFHSAGRTIAAAGSGHPRTARRSSASSLLARHAVSVEQMWTISELYAELERFEQAAMAAGLAESSVRTYVDRSRNFVRWLAGEFEFHGPWR
jgi:hypothetical protein